MVKIGLKVASAKSDVTMATLSKQLFNSDYPVFKIAFQGNLKLTMAAGNGVIMQVSSISFTHGLGYIPAFRCYARASGTANQYQPTDFTSFFGQANNNYIWVRTTSSQLIVYGGNFNNVEISVDVYYYIYADPL